MIAVKLSWQTDQPMVGQVRWREDDSSECLILFSITTRSASGMSAS